MLASRLGYESTGGTSCGGKSTYVAICWAFADDSLCDAEEKQHPSRATIASTQFSRSSLKKKRPSIRDLGPFTNHSQFISNTKHGNIAAFGMASDMCE